MFPYDATMSLYNINDKAILLVLDIVNYNTLYRTHIKLCFLQLPGLVCFSKHVAWGFDVCCRCAMTILIRIDSYFIVIHLYMHILYR